MTLTVTPLNNNKYYNPSFKGASAKTATTAMDVIRQGSKESEFFKPLNDAYDKFTTNIAENFTSHIVNWEPLAKLADKLKNSNNLFQYCLTLGSVITSGLYMQRTLANKNMDKDRRQTLAVNQGLTLVVSTAGAYLLDGYMKDWWDNVTAKFASYLLGDDEEFYNKFINEKNAIKEENKTIKAKAKTEGTKLELKKIKGVEERIKSHPYFKRLNKEEASVLLSKVKGMGPLRSMLVFGFVYRFFVPVAVTKPSNKLCEKFLNYKKNKSQNVTAQNS